MDPDFLEEMGRVEGAHWWFRARREIIVAVLRAQRLPAEIRVLDVGCGTGANLAALRDTLHDADIVGLDPSERAREVCARRGLPTIAGAATELPFADATFDLVTAFDVLEHVADDAGAVAELQRVLRPGGSAIVTVPALPWMWGPHDARAHHRWRGPRAGSGASRRDDRRSRWACGRRSRSAPRLHHHSREEPVSWPDPV